MYEFTRKCKKQLVILMNFLVGHGATHLHQGNWVGGNDCRYSIILNWVCWIYFRDSCTSCICACTSWSDTFSWYISYISPRKSSGRWGGGLYNSALLTSTEGPTTEVSCPGGRAAAGTEWEWPVAELCDSAMSKNLQNQKAARRGNEEYWRPTSS